MNLQTIKVVIYCCLSTVIWWKSGAQVFLPHPPWIGLRSQQSNRGRYYGSWYSPKYLWHPYYKGLYRQTGMWCLKPNLVFRLCLEQPKWYPKTYKLKPLLIPKLIGRSKAILYTLWLASVSPVSVLFDYHIDPTQMNKKLETKTFH